MVSTKGTIHLNPGFSRALYEPNRNFSALLYSKMTLMPRRKNKPINNPISNGGVIAKVFKEPAANTP
jgi:hypothetical protein